MRRIEAGKYEVDCNGTKAIVWQRTERGMNPVSGRERDMRFWGFTVGDYIADGYATKQEAWIAAYRFAERARAMVAEDAARERRREARKVAKNEIGGRAHP